jgi:predicted nuclease of predicted toxin-antitoxin system
MRLLIDENCDRFLIDLLRRAGHDVAWMVEEGPGAGDQAIAQRAATDQRIVVTQDLDFVDIVRAGGAHAASVILLRLEPLSARARCALAADAIGRLTIPPTGTIAIIEPSQTRFRTFGEWRERPGAMPR